MQMAEACGALQQVVADRFEELSMIWFTADTHFGHAAVIRHSRRPFESVEAHDAALIANWNAIVRKGDTVYHCGDFAWHDPTHYRSLLSGQIHLVKGNHDRLKAGAEAAFVTVSDIKKVKIGVQKIYLCHYAMRVWNCSHYGSWQLYGHSHGSLSDDPRARSLDVGVDCHGYAPVSFDRVSELMALKNYTPVDHHAPGAK